MTAILQGMQRGIGYIRTSAGAGVMQALKYQRFTIMGQCFLDELEEVAEVDIGKITDFARS